MESAEGADFDDLSGDLVDSSEAVTEDIKQGKPILFFPNNLSRPKLIKE